MEKSIVGRETGKTRLSALHSLLRGIFSLNCLEVSKIVRIFVRDNER